MSIILVPHVFRQEVAAGKNSAHYQEHDSANMFTGLTNAIKGINSSPINFFDPDLKKYPFWKNVDKLTVEMNEGDCIFIPAYHYYQFKSQNFGPR